MPQKKKLSGNKIRPFSGQYHFVDLETAYRVNAGKSPDVVKIDGTAGFRYNENILLLAQFFSTIATSTVPVNTLANTQDSVNRYTNVKFELSGVVQTSKTTSVQLGIYEGAYSEIMENNYKTYHGITLSLWKGF